MEKKDKQPGRTCIVSLGDGHSEYTINSTTYIVQCKYQKTTFTEKNRTFADVIEDIINNGYIDLVAEMEKAES